jgi:hypothetical protein
VLSGPTRLRKQGSEPIEERGSIQVDWLGEAQILEVEAQVRGRASGEVA